MQPSLESRAGSPRLRRLDDERLAALVRTGDAAAFEALYDRHHASLLAFCRHMVGNREDGEDALQQTFLRAHRALRDGRPPDSVRPWLFAIARNRCRTLLAARRDAAVPSDDLEPAYDGLAEDVHRRAELRELVADLALLPEDQRGALVLFELGDLSHPEIATVIGCAPEKVKALVFQARTALIAEREARSTPCDEIRGQLEVARGGALRRGPLRRHLRHCEPCDTYRLAVARQRTGLALILPVAPTAGLKAAVLAGASGASGGGGAAAAALGAAASGSASTGGAAAATAVGGSAATGGGAAAITGGLAVKALVAKVAVTAVVAGAGVSGGVAAVDAGSGPEPIRAAEQTAQRVAGTQPRPASQRPVEAPLTDGTRAVTVAGSPRRVASIRRRAGAARRRAVRRALRRHGAGPRARRAMRRRLRHAGGRPRAARRRARRLRRAAAGLPPTVQQQARREEKRRRARRRDDITRRERRRAREEARSEAGDEASGEARERVRPRRRPRGKPGATGDSDEPGDTGDSGEPGATGDSGEPGETGDSGEPGATGDSGEPNRPRRRRKPPAPTPDEPATPAPTPAPTPTPSPKVGPSPQPEATPTPAGTPAPPS